MVSLEASMNAHEIDLNTATLLTMQHSRLVQTRNVLRRVLFDAARAKRKISELSKRSSTPRIERAVRAVHESHECVQALGGIRVICARIGLINALLDRRS